jgi:small subunit ribosomal protein S17
MQGTVVSDVMDRTVVVQVERVKAHRLYHKVVRRHSRYMAHDEENAARTGDVVIIEECRPMSRHKRWMVVGWVQREGST